MRERRRRRGRRGRRGGGAKGPGLLHDMNTNYDLFLTRSIAFNKNPLNKKKNIVQNGRKWLEMIQDVPKWSKIVKNTPNGQASSKLVLNGQT